jgi:hypothetical protein
LAHVFVSHAITDRKAAAPIIEALAQAGFVVSHGSSIATEQGRADMRGAEGVVVLWSQAAAESSSLAEDTREAVRLWSSGRLLLATLDDTPLPLGLRDIPTTSIHDGSSVEQLAKLAKDIVRRPTAGVALGPPDHGKRAIKSLANSLLVILGHIYRGIVAIVVTLIIIWLMIASGFSVVFQTFDLFAWLTGSKQVFSGIHRHFDFLFNAMGADTSLFLLLIGLGVGLGLGVISTILAKWAWKRRSYIRSKPSAALPLISPLPSSQTRVFISYSHKDGPAVYKLTHQIEQMGYPVWIDRESTSGLSRYAANIVPAIKTSRLVAVMCSQSAFASDHVIREIYLAGDYKKPFIAFELDSTEFPDEIRYFLSGFPRIPIAKIDIQSLRLEITKLISI